MNSNIALKVLAAVMEWDDEHARQEYTWLRLISRFKYDGYRDFQAGMRFVESLADWLQQFETQAERRAGYNFVRYHLIYIGTSELQHLVDLMYPDTIELYLSLDVAERLVIPSYRIWADPASISKYDELLNKTLFLGLSDGARIDVFRRSNVGRISNEQVFMATQIDDEKWGDLLKDLRKRLCDNSARFSGVFVIDDFTASGTSLLRYDNGEWKGKLARFWRNVKNKLDTHFEQDWILYVHHYIASFYASTEIVKRDKAARAELGVDWFPRVKFTFGTVLSEDLPINEHQLPDFISIVDKYYDADLDTDHTQQGGTNDVKRGFGNCALPIVLEHNTPNNSFALLWADTQGKKGHEMRPLFRRRHRHS